MMNKYIISKYIYASSSSFSILISTPTSVANKTKNNPISIFQIPI